MLCASIHVTLDISLGELALSPVPSLSLSLTSLPSPLLPVIAQYNKSTVALQGELPIMVPILFLLAIFVPYTTGWVLGCTHNLPVLPVLFLTNMDLVRPAAMPMTPRGCFVGLPLSLHFSLWGRVAPLEVDAFV